MVWWVTLLWYIGATIVTELLRPKPNLENARPKALGDFNFPTAQEGRVIPVWWGTVVQKGPNLVWFGDLSSEAITEKVKTGMFSSDTVTKGFKYSVGMQLALGRGELTSNGVDGVRRIWVDDKLVRDGVGSPEVFTPVDIGDISISRSDFTGEESNLVGTLEIVPGSTGQSVNSYLTSVVAGGAAELPAYRGTAYALWKGGEIGTSASLQPWKFEVTRIPNGLALVGSPNMSRIWEGGVPHANPMNVLYEIMTNTDWGAGVASSLIDVIGFAETAETLYDEGSGFSLLLDNPKKIGDIISEIERQVDGVLFLNETSGLYEFLLARDDIESPDLTATVDPSNCKNVSFSRTSWENTINEVRVPYNDPTKDYAESYAIAVDGANNRIQGANVGTTTTFPGVKQGSLAAKLCWRELRFMAYPLSKVTMKVDRSLFAIKPTERIDLTWPPLGINNVRYRISKIEFGEMEDGMMTLEGIEDIFQTEISSFSDPIASRWLPASSDPVQPLAAILFELPVPMQTVTGTQVGICAVRGNSFQVAYDVYATSANLGASPLANTNDADFAFETTVSDWTPSGVLTAVIDRTDEFVTLPSPPGTIDFDDTTDIDIVIAGGSAVLTDVTEVNIINFIRINREIIFYEEIVDNGGGDYSLRGVHRGMMDTVPADHQIGDRIFFISFGIGRLPADNAVYPATRDSVAVRIASTTPAKTISLANASEAYIVLDHAFAAEAPPADPYVNDDQFFEIGLSISPQGVTCGDLAFTAKGRNLIDQQGTGPSIDQSDADAPPAGGTGYVVDIYREDVSPRALVFRQIGIPHAADAISPEGISYNAAASRYLIPADTRSPVVSPEGPVKDYSVEIYSRKAGVDSQRWVSDAFQVTGYGLDYGEYYGGLCNEGVNLEQGDPPTVIEPIPGVGNLQQWRLTVSGTHGGGADDAALRYSYFDSLEATSGVGTIVVDGATYTAISEIVSYVAGELTSILPSTFSVDVIGSEITVSTEFGNFSLRPHFSDAAGLPWRYSSTLQEAEQAATAGLANTGTYGLDMYNTALDGFGIPVDVLGPSQAIEYGQQGTYFKGFSVQGLTYDRRKELDFKAVIINGTANYSAAVQVRPYNILQNEFVDSFNDSELGTYATSISAGSVPSGDRPTLRPAIVRIQLDENYIAYSGGQVYASAEPQISDPYRLVWKEHSIPFVYAPSGLPRTYWINPALGLADTAGLQTEIEIDGVIVATEAIGSPFDNATFLQGLADQLDGYLSQYTSEVLTANGRLEIRGALNTAYDLHVYSSLGLRYKFEELQ